MICIENNNIKINVAPEMGMALMNFTVCNRSILNQNLKEDFYQNRKGLGPIILPHFNQAPPVSFKKIDPDDKKYKLFPHIKYLQEIGISHPFQHGIGRYLAWNYHLNDNAIIGTISGEDKVGSFTLKKLNGFDFNCKVIYRLFEDYVSIKLEVSGEMPVATGIHFYYDSVDENSIISLDAYQKQERIKTIYLNENHNDVLTPISDENGFSKVLLRTSRYNLLTKFMVEGESDKVFESLIIFSDKEKKFVCVEPISYKVGERNTKERHFGEIQLIPGIEECKPN